MKIRNRRKLVSNRLTVNSFVSEAQRRKCWVADDPAWDCREWSHATKDIKSLPSKIGNARKKAKRKLTANKGRVRTDKGRAGPNKVDPSRTLTMRRWMATQLRKRFGALKGRIYKLVVQEDAFGLLSKEPLSFNEFNPDQQRDEHGKWTRAGAALTTVVDSIKAAGALAAHVEHAVSAYVKDGIGKAVAKLPSPLQAVATGAFIGGKALTAVAFANWTLGQNLAERVSRERGATPEEARRLRGVLSTIDSKTFEAFKVTALVGVHAAHLPAVITGTVPAATTAYLCYSTARDPLATIRAATKMVKGLVPEQRLAGNAAIDRVQLLDRVLLAHGYDDWYIALLSAALDHTGNVADAVTLADGLYELSPEQPATVPSSQEDGGQDLFGSLTGNSDGRVADGQQRGYGTTGRGDEQRPQSVGGTLAPEAEGPRALGGHQGEVRNTRWQFATSADKVKAFQDWLRAQVKDTLTSVSDEELWHRYIEAGFRKGAGRSYDDVKRKATAAGGQDALDFYSGTRDEFLRDSFAQPVTREKVELLAGRAYDDLEGITEDMGLRMSRSLADGLVEGKSPLDVARDLNDDLELGKDRSILIARTEVVRAHAEGQLTALEGLGVDEIGVAVEWSSTGDGKVCPQCQPLQGVVLTVDEARGLLPRHPQCRCAFTPANVGEDEGGQKRSKPDIDTALKESVEAEVTPKGTGRGKKGIPAKPRESDWAGADLDVDEHRPVQEPLAPPQVANLSDGDLLTRFVNALNSVDNAFCPTGEGGGVDPSCGKGSSGPVSVVSQMERAKADAIAARYGEHGKDWEEVQDKFPALSTPVFHVTKQAIQVMEDGLASGKGSVFGRGNVNSVSMTSNLDWVTKGQGASFGRYVFVMDEKDIGKHGKIRDHQAPDADDYEFERRFEGSKIPPSEIKGLVVTKHMGRMEKEEAGEWPFPVVYKDKDKGWTKVPKAGGVGNALPDSFQESVDNVRREFFAECNRDDKGHCTAGEGGSGKAPAHEQEASRKLADSKIAKAPVPSPEKKAAYSAKVAKYLAAVKKAREDGTKEPQQREFLDARGNTGDRKRRAQQLFKEFGGEEKGYVVCPWTGIKMHWTDDKTANPKGYPKFEQGKIFTAVQGGGYQPANLIPESFAANRVRGNTPARKENL